MRAACGVLWLTDGQKLTHPQFPHDFITGVGVGGKNTFEGICSLHHLRLECDYQSHPSVFRLQENATAHKSRSLPSDGEVWQFWFYN